MSISAANRLLMSLTTEAREKLTARSVQVKLPVRTPLFEPEKTPDYVYFLTSGMASIVNYTVDGGSAEVGIAGFEGMVGGLQMLGPAKVHVSAGMQLDGAGLRIPYEHAKRMFLESEEIRGRMLEYHQVQAIATTQLAACNRLHDAEARLARWLLMARDCTGRDELSFTQEFLAMMLGSRRPTVTLVAGMLQRAGLIEYSRGHVTIIKGESLQDAACDCYAITRGLTKNLYSSPLN